jgi:hypothetical protein
MTPARQLALPLADPSLPPWPLDWTFVGTWLFEGIGFCAHGSAGAATVRLRQRAIDAALAAGLLEQAELRSYSGPGATPEDLEIILPVGAPLPPRVERLERRCQVGSSSSSCRVIRQAGGRR